MQSLQLQLSVHGTIGTDDCDNEHHVGITQYSFIDKNKPNKYQEEVLLLELWGQLYSWE